MQPKLEKKLDTHPGKVEDTRKTVEVSKPTPTKPPALSMFSDDQINILQDLYQPSAPEVTTVQQEPIPSTSMEVTEPWKSHIYEMYEQSFNITEEEASPMFVDDLDEDQTPVKTAPLPPTQDEIDSR